MKTYSLALVIGIGIILSVLWQGIALAHCDTMDGPVVADAKTALEKGDVTPVLKWVQKDDEETIRSAFQNTLTVRSKGPEAKDLADMYFYETLVRIHRAGEGAPYTGLKPAGAEFDPAVVGADKALETGSVDSLIKEVTEAVADGIHGRFERTMEAKKHADESVETGREYVEAYVDYVHYVERLSMDAEGAAHGETEVAADEQHTH